MTTSVLSSLSFLEVKASCKTPIALHVFGPLAAPSIELQNKVVMAFKKDIFSHIIQKLEFKIPIVWTLIWKECCLLLWNCVIKLECCTRPVWLTIIRTLPKIILYYRVRVSHNGNCLLTHKDKRPQMCKAGRGFFFNLTVAIRRLA